MAAWRTLLRPAPLAAALLVLAAALLPRTALAATGGEHEVVVVNQGRFAVNELYISPSASEEWGDDRLGEAMLAPGHSLRLRLGRGPDCLVDVQAVYEDGGREERHGLDICHDRRIVLDSSRASAPPAERAAHAVTIVNEAARPIQQVLISPADAGDWGDDLLDNESLSVGERTSVGYQGSCLADLRIVFDNRAAEERRGLDLCALGGVRIRPGWTTADTLLPLPPPAGAAVAMTVTVVNHSGHAAREVFVAPAGAAERGPDLLGAGALEDGASAALAFAAPGGACRFDVHAVFGGKAPDQDLRGLDLCKNPTVTLLPQT